MSIEVPAAAVYALADALRERAAEADEARARLARAVDVGGPVQSAVEAFLAGHRLAAEALAGELRWLGGTVTEVADSWLALDGALLVRAGRPGPR